MNLVISIKDSFVIEKALIFIVDQYNKNGSLSNLSSSDHDTALLLIHYIRKIRGNFE